MFKFNSKRLTIIAMMIALNIVVNTFELNLTQELKLSFSLTITTLSGLLTGFIGGALTGFLGDLLGCFIQGLTPIPLLSLSNTLYGLIPGLAFDLYKYFKRKKVSIVWGSGLIIFCQLLIFGLCTVLINPYAIYSFYGLAKDSYWAWVVLRIFPIQLVNSVGNLVISLLLFISISRIPFFNQYLDGYKSKNDVKQEIEGGNDSTGKQKR